MFNKGNIIKNMNAKAQKAAKLLAKCTVKIQTLLKDFPPAFEDEQKEAYNRQSLYYHKHQNGLIKISRWQFDHERKTPLILEKNPIQIEKSDSLYTYAENAEGFDEETSQSFWVNFSSAKLFYDCEQDYFSQGDSMVLSHPLLLSCKNYVASLADENFTALTEMNGEPTPFVFQNVPRWVNVNDFSLSDKFDVIVKEEKSSIISMKAPTGRGQYTEEQIEYLLETVLSAFGGAVKSALEVKKTECTLHTGNWGLGNLGNNAELIYLVQMIGASAAGMSRIVFHSPEKEAFENAKTVFSNLGETNRFNNIVKFLLSKEYKWLLGEIEGKLFDLGLNFGM